MNAKDVDNRITRMLNGVRQAFRGVLGSVSSDGPVQMSQGEGLAGENLPDLELFQHYGYTSNPPAGTMKIVVPLGGKTSHGVIVATEHGSYRLKSLPAGAVALYTDEGDSVVLNRGRVIDITTKTLNINAEETVNIATKTLNISAGTGTTIDTPTATLTHELSVAEQITGKGGMSMSGGDGAQIDNLNVSGKAKIGDIDFNNHGHPETGSTTRTPVQL
ncbi:hypothetical protein LMG29542_04776 [Paraburkholderia humisilvae]|uniref:Bacteriophage Mu Gp45 N-terminal domain-containing protein n=3 Tax=Paraburkholderia humisilvae TaxID=627669 RepID=A0A6J5EC93_9BURK|nr:hypothetical protein LMG29542_04776 [Paraburkholderia humisilvae]